MNKLLCFPSQKAVNKLSFLVYNISCLCFVHARDIDCFAFNRVLVK